MSGRRLPRLRLRLLPRSLGGQLIALLLLALVASQGVALWLLAGERRVAIYEAIGDGVILRSASLLPLLEGADAPMRDQILRATSTPVTRFWVAPTPLVDRPGASAPERRLEDALVEELGAGRDIRVELIGRDKPDGRPRPQPARDDDGSDPGRTPDQGPDRGPDRRAEDGRAGAEQSRLERQREQEDRASERMRRTLLALNFSVRLGDGTWLNVTANHRPPPTAAFRTLLIQIVLMAASIVLIIAVTIRQVSRPMLALAGAADRLGRGEAVPPLPVAGPAEVRQTIQAFNAMQERLSRFVRDRTRMLAAISHDLRTPITSLRIRAEFIEDDEDREKFIATLDEMAAMTEATLAFARDEAVHEPQDAVDLPALLETLVGDQVDMGRTVRLETTAPVRLACRPLALKRALRNLIENAVRYGGVARISQGAGEGHARIVIDDDGPGIPPDRLQDVFEPFVRLETSRSTETGGIGLGLAITRSIIHAHGGTITLENRPGGGLRATVLLPL
ncbi:HAMP domain-containing protein [Microvirga tunisiensis]|uniref:histidine kinase n=1 Tax=Pannonibacter tanglangensis TaxID=2750084 RepID=A0A7X5F2G4_9HYPH|nr:ATP-binding protein [Pannonibacter sp. XCT-53]NBN78558.1 HAMP domain-containing protein [Pannonibacter sp. XCT-53]